MNLEETQNDLAKVVVNRALPVVLGALLLALPLRAQTLASANAENAPAPNSTVGAPSAPAVGVSPEVINELEAMKKRIEELEAELKARPGAAATPVTTSTGAAAMPANAAIAAAPVQTVPATMSNVAEAAPVKPEKIAPFSDWDWTWLNGNPRNKDTAFDSKFSRPRFARTSLTTTISINRSITQKADRANYFARMKSS